VAEQNRLTYDPAARYEVESVDVVYRDDGDTQWSMTIFQPQADGPFPVLLRVHGGAWNVGDRQGAAHIDRSLAECGMVVAAIDFRQAPEHPYPAQVQDTNYAVRWLKLHAAEYNVDTSCFGGAGDSSGGHTMLLNAMRPNDPSYGELELEGAEGLDASVDYVLGMWAVVNPYLRYHYARAIGWQLKIDQHEGYFLTTEAMREANPQMILERGDPAELPPVLIIQGDTDDNIPNYMPLMFEHAYAAAGGSLRLEWFPGMPHAFAKEPGEESDRAIEIMRDFVAEQIAASRA
jgi:acetyl esterase